MLPQVERGEVKTEDLRLANEDSEPSVRKPLTLVLAQAVPHQTQVRHKLLDAAVGVGNRHMIRSPRPLIRFESRRQLPVDVCTLVAIGLHRVARVDPESLIRKKLGIAIKAFNQSSGDAVAS